MEFSYAPGTKILVLASGVGSAVMLASKIPVVGYDLFAFSNIRIQKLFLSQILFGSVGEFILGLGLLYHFRFLERRSGSSRFIMHTFLSTAMSLTLQMIYLVFWPLNAEDAYQRIAPGPYSIIFSLLVQYFAVIPKLQRYRFFGIDFSEKTMIYACAVQLLIARGRESWIPSLCGMIGGLVCMTPLLPFSRLQFPKFLRDAFSTYVVPILGTTDVPIRAARVPPEQQQQQRGGGGVGVSANVSNPSPEQIQSLVQMGFPRQSVMEALRVCNNNVERAADLLLHQAN